MKKYLRLVFWALIGVFLLILAQFFVPAVGELFKGSLFFLLPFVIFFLLGIILMFLTVKEKMMGKLKKFLMLTGASSTGFFLFVLLHNLFYGLGIMAEDIVVLNYLAEILHVVFFMAAIFVCPLGFLIGVIGSAVLFIKKSGFKNNR